MEKITLSLIPKTQHTHAIDIETLWGKESGPPLEL